MDYFRCYRDFVSKKLRILSNVLCLGVMFFSILLTVVISPVIVVVVGSELVVFVEVILDFFSFGGISVKKQKVMEFLKGSLEGETVLKKALFADMVKHFVHAMIVPVAILIEMLLTGQRIGVAYGICMVISFASCAAAIIMIALIFTRKFAQLLTTHFLVMYLSAGVASFLIIVPSLLFMEMTFSILQVLGAIVLFAVFVGTGILNVSTCTKGYKSGFYDN